MQKEFILTSPVDLNSIAKEARRLIVKAAHKSRCPHVACALSCVDILTVIYFDVLRLDPWEKHDICILSKGHAALALYSVLALKGIIKKEMLEGYFMNNGSLPAHLDKFTAPGIEVSAGSLGHGFNIGLGMAFGFKKKGADRRVYAVIGDGESQEGSIWEGAMFASKLGIDNFTAIMDYNNLQGYGRSRDICSFEPVRDKWESFGWQVEEVDGHDKQSLRKVLQNKNYGKPRIIIAHTTKGKGVSFMEDQLVWHYYIVTEEHKQRALEELK